MSVGIPWGISTDTHTHTPAYTHTHLVGMGFPMGKPTMGIPMGSHCRDMDKNNCTSIQT